MNTITPSPELVQQWLGEFFGCMVSGELSDSERFLTTRAAQWGADQELEACCKWLRESVCEGGWSQHLRAARRPKPPSLKEQALDALGPEPLPETGPTGDAILNKGSIERHRCIRRALEQLDD
jgi:hypothetical protein